MGFVDETGAHICTKKYPNNPTPCKCEGLCEEEKRERETQRRNQEAEDDVIQNFGEPQEGEQ